MAKVTVIHSYHLATTSSPCLIQLGYSLYTTQDIVQLLNGQTKTNTIAPLPQSPPLLTDFFYMYLFVSPSPPPSFPNILFPFPFSLHVSLSLPPRPVDELSACVIYTSGKASSTADLMAAVMETRNLMSVCVCVCVCVQMHVYAC